MLRSFLAILLVFPLRLVAADPPAPPPLFHADFDHDGALESWQLTQPKSVRLDQGVGSSRALRVEIPAGQAGSANANIPLPVERMRGARVRCEAVIRAEHVSPPPNPWNGVKCMLHITTPTGDVWPQQNLPGASFDWKKVRFETKIPENATAATLVLGLENVSGIASFDQVSLTVTRPPRQRPSSPPPAGPPFKGHQLPRLRGTMIGTTVNADDLTELARTWGANHVRWQLLWGGFPHSPADNGDLAAYDQWMDGQMKRLDDLLPVCRKLGIRVLIDLHTPPGGRDKDANCRLFHEKRFQDNFLAWWRKMALRFRDEPAVWGYDLVNEPVEGEVGPACMDWQTLATAAARVVREQDPHKAIIVEPAPWGGPEALENLDPLPVPGVVYSVHMYQPHRFTHQGVHSSSPPIHYPGTVDGRHWDKEALRRVLQPVRDFQQDFGVHIYLGEFSAIRWAPGESACRYLSDCIDLFEEFGWDWAYHAFREWDGWSVEHGPDRDNRQRTPEPTDRALLLRRWFAKNQTAP